MDRRSFMEMAASASVAACGFLTPWLALTSDEGKGEGEGEGSKEPLPIALVDTTLVESRAYAELAATHDGAHIVDIDDDVGTLWHARLRRANTRLVGALRASDFFVLRYLAAGEGRIVSVSHTSDARAVTFRIAAAARTAG